MHKHRSRRLAGAIAGAATLAVAVLAVGIADADPITGTSEVTGTVNVGENTLDLPDGSAFTGTVDPDVGTIDGDLVIPDIYYDVTNPLPTVATIQITIPGGITGTIDDDGDVIASAVARIELTDVAALGPQTGCVFEPVNLELVGTFDAETGALNLEDTQFTIPPTGDACALAAIVNGLLAGDANSIVLDVALGVPPSEPITTTTTTTTTTTPTSVVPTTAPGTPAPPAAPGTPGAPAAAPARAIQGDAAYTG